MKALKGILLVILFAVLFVSCQKVPPGFKGIKVYTLGEKKGTMDQLDTGRYHIGVRAELHTFPKFQQNYVWTADKREMSPENESFTFSDTMGLSVNVDMGITYHLQEDMIADIFVAYRKGVDELTDIVIRNVVRGALNSHGASFNVEDIMGTGKVELADKILASVKEELDAKGIIVDSIYWVGAPRPPDNVITAINAKIAAIQQAQQRENEVKEAEAAAKKQKATADGDYYEKIKNAEAEANSLLQLAEAEAKANTLRQKSYTPQVLQALWIERWNGILPEYMTEGAAQLILGQ